MEKIIEKLFLDYLSEQTVVTKPSYTAITKETLQKEQELRNLLNAQQTKAFEEVLELTSQIHFLEVKDAFFAACKLGANAFREFVI